VFDGPILPGYIAGNDMILKVWDHSEEEEYNATYTTSFGSGTFNGLFTNISSINLIIPGCTDSEANNYNLEATMDDDSCVYAPSLFEHTQSTLQAFYFFKAALIDGIPLDNDDWIGVFNGDVCVGAGQWCGDESGGCDVPAMGYDSSTPTTAINTAGYLNPGDIPTFKFYNSLEDIYIDAFPSGEGSENLAFSSTSHITIDLISGCSTATAFTCTVIFSATTRY
jgi:hypothetical protein